LTDKQITDRFILAFDLSDLQAIDPTIQLDDIYALAAPVEPRGPGVSDRSNQPSAGERATVSIRLRLFP
jgi:hypothetical protein